MNMLKMCVCVSVVCACAFGADVELVREYDNAEGIVSANCKQIEDKKWGSKLQEARRIAVLDIRENMGMYVDRIRIWSCIKKYSKTQKWVHILWEKIRDIAEQRGTEEWEPNDAWEWGKLQDIAWG